MWPAVLTRERERKTMKCKALLGLRLLLAALAVALGSGQTGGLSLVVQQIETIGPRQWLGLMAGSIVSATPVISPVGERIARALPRLLTVGGPQPDSDTA
jgi:hypothetical protein